MARLVKKDTFMYEEVNPHGDMVRRQVFAGQMIPDHYVDGEDTAAGAVEDVDHAKGPGLGAGAQDYAHNRGVSVEAQLKRRGGKAPTKAQIAAARDGGQAAADASKTSASEKD